MKNKSLKYKIGQIVYNAINEAFDFNAEEIDTGNDYDVARRDAYLFSIRDSGNVNKILKDFYGISKFKKYKHAYIDNKIGNVYVLDGRSTQESALTDKMINLLINQNFSTYYFYANPYNLKTITDENNTTYSKKELLNNLEAVIKNVYKINVITPMLSYKIYVSPDKKLLIYDNLALFDMRYGVKIIPSFIIINGEITYKSTNDDFLKSVYSFSNIIEAEKLKLWSEGYSGCNHDNNSLSIYQKIYTAANNTLFKVLRVKPEYENKKPICVDTKPLHFKRNLRLFLGGMGCQTYEPVKNEITKKTFIQESVFSLGLVKFIITDDKDYIKNTLGKDVLNIKPYYLKVYNVKKLKHPTSLDEIYAFIVLTAKGKLVCERIKDKKAISPEAIRELAMNL